MALFQGPDLHPVGRIGLGKDADNIRIDANAHRVIVGYGSGALAVIDSMSRKTIAHITRKGHPEGFQLNSNGTQAFVNVPDAHEIAAVNFSQNKHRTLLRG